MNSLTTCRGRSSSLVATIRKNYEENRDYGIRISKATKDVAKLKDLTRDAQSDSIVESE
jgi:hypothetical protein